MNKNKKIITTNQANEIMKGMAVIPGMETVILRTMGYEIRDEVPFKSKALDTTRSQRGSTSINSYTQFDTQDYHVLAVSRRVADYSGPGVAKWTELILEYAEKEHLENVVSRTLENLQITDAYSPRFNSFYSSLINTDIKEVETNIVLAKYLNPDKDKGIEITYDLVNNRVIR